MNTICFEKNIAILLYDVLTHSLHLPFIWQDIREQAFKQVPHIIICHVLRKCHATLEPLSFSQLCNF